MDSTLKVLGYKATVQRICTQYMEFVYMDGRMNILGLQILRDSSLGILSVLGCVFLVELHIISETLEN